jgi:peptide/nickel transport system permease protein
MRRRPVSRRDRFLFAAIGRPPMTVFIIRRLLQSLLVIAVMTVLVFAGVYAIGNPIDIMISPEATEAERQAAIIRLGLDKSLPEQYLAFLGNLLQGDLGRSFVFSEPALQQVLQRMPATMELAFAAMLISIVVGIPLGLYAGLKPDGFGGKSIMAGSIFGFSLPNFWQGLMLIMIFAVFLQWLPAGGRGERATVLGIESSLWTLDGWSHLILPAINLALFKTSLVIRLTRASVRETINLDYVKFARAKGLSQQRVIGVHVLKNIMIPLVTIIGLELGSVIAFAVVTETVFAWPGMGKLIIDSIFQLDRPVIVAYLIVIVCLFITINLVVDLLYSALDPRVRLADQKA